MTTLKVTNNSMKEVNLKNDSIFNITSFDIQITDLCKKIEHANSLIEEASNDIIKLISNDEFMSNLSALDMDRKKLLILKHCLDQHINNISNYLSEYVLED